MDQRKNSLGKSKSYDMIDIARVVGSNGCMSKLSLACCPGKNNTLNRDLSIIKKENIDIIVCLLEWSEMEILGISDYPNKVHESGFLFYHMPIKDRGVPKTEDIKVLIYTLVTKLLEGKNVLVHCRGGLGRAGLVCACCLCHFGYQGKESIETVRRLREGAIQTEKQEEVVLMYKKYLCR